jgi:lycopene cyclase domain-containing protein
VTLTVVSDLLILRTKLIYKKNFWIFWAVMFMLIVIVNGYLTARPIVLYNDNYFMNIRFITIPLEDFLFGFSLISSNVIIWEYFTGKWVKK